MEIIKEGSAKIFISERSKISKELEVFYNPVMKLNRDISVLILSTISKKDMQIALPLAGTGIRGIRFLKELEKKKIKEISFNDYFSKKHIKKNLSLNNIEKDKKIIVSNKDANQFLLESKGFDYIDVDPFGSPNPFLDNSIVRLSRSGILAVTATDTSALSGSHPSACKRKYWATPMRNEMMHEIGIRILIRKIQLLGAQNEKSLIPIFSYSKDHYFRLFFSCEKGKQKVDEILKKHEFFLYNPKTMEREVSKFNYKKDFDYSGPLWTGKLWDEKLVEKMFNKCDKGNKELYDLLSIIKEESKIDNVGFYDLHKLAKLKKKPIPKIETMLKKGNSRTHFLGWGIKAEKLHNLA
jgi:tRNA (guanine26-N2/guanine27-N2)-dimethyltransferase